MPPAIAVGAFVAVKAYGQYKAAKEAKKASEASARAAREVAALREQQQRYLDRQTIARARSVAAGSGVDINEGSPLDVRAESMRQMELNAYIISRGGELQAAEYKRQGDAARIAGYTNALGTVLGGYSNISSIGGGGGGGAGGGGGTAYEVPSHWDLG